MYSPPLNQGCDRAKHGGSGKDTRVSGFLSPFTLKNFKGKVHPIKNAIIFALKFFGMKALYTIGLLVLSNTFMTFAWYGHLKFKEMKGMEHLPLLGFLFLTLAVYFIFKK